MALVSRKERSRYPTYREREPGLFSMRDEMNRVFNDFFRSRGLDWPLWPAWRPTSAGEFVPAVDVSDTDGEIRVSAELPGMTEEDIDVQVDEDTLTISGEKRLEEEEERDGRYWRESSYGHFVREVPLPAKVETDKAEASYRNGRLEVKLPKSEESKAKRHSIKIRSE